MKKCWGLKKTDTKEKSSVELRNLILNLQKCPRVNDVNDSFQPSKLYIIEKTTIKDEITSCRCHLFISLLGKPWRTNRTAYIKSELKATLLPNVRFDQR